MTSGSKSEKSESTPKFKKGDDVWITQSMIWEIENGRYFSEELFHPFPATITYAPMTDKHYYDSYAVKETRTNDEVYANHESKNVFSTLEEAKEKCKQNLHRHIEHLESEIARCKNILDNWS